MKEKINQELIRLQQELSNLQTAAEQLSKAEKASSDVIGATRELSLKFGESLKNISEISAKFYADSHTSTQTQLDQTLSAHKLDLEQLIVNLTDLHKGIQQNEMGLTYHLNALALSHKEQIEAVNKLLRNYLDLASSTAKLSDKIDSIDFPANLGKISANISEINSEFRSVKTEIAALTPILYRYDKRIRRNNRKINIALIFGISAFIIVAFGVWQTAVVPHFPELDIFQFITPAE